ncbi:MAG: TolC family protein [Fimbriimonas sp.]|nr:TolC family protein [Fimbriimonas sp.]
MIAVMHGGMNAQAGAMTLDEAVRQAETNAFAVRLQQTVIEKNRQKVNQSQGSLGPAISFGASYLRYDQAVTAQFSSASPPITIQPIDVKTVNATLTMPIDIAGNMTRLLHANQASRRSSELTLNATYNDTRLSVRQAYFSVLRAKAQIVVDEKALTDAKDRLDQGQKQFDQQQVAKLDVTRYQAQVAQSNSDLISAKDSLTLANYAFNLALARPIETAVSLVDMDELPALTPTEDDLVKAAQTKRPEVLAAKETLKALALITRATESSMNPTLNLQIQSSETIDPSGFTQTGAQTTGTLLLNIPIFDSGVTRAKVKQARQDETTARINLEQTKLQISQEVRNAIANLSSARARLDNATEQVRLAEEVYRLAKVKQDAGAGTYYEVVDAESQLTLARNGQVSARYDYLTSYSQLQRAVGQDDLTAAIASTANGSRGK